MPGAFTPGVKRPWREANYSSASSVEDKNAWRYTSVPPVRLHGVVLIEPRGRFISGVKAPGAR